MPHGDGVSEDDEGYEVRPEILEEAAAASIQVGADVDELAPVVRSASAQVQRPPAGWQLGANLLEVVPLWQQHLNTIAAELRHTGSTLETNAVSYAAMETEHAEKFQSLH